jgi:surfeit locus 1 family protein
MMVWRKIAYFILFGFVFFALLGLGYWQYTRYQAKKEWLAVIERTKKQPDLLAADLDENRITPFRRLRLWGSWKKKQSFLISGDIRHGQSGYSVITPLEWAPSKPWVLVDRGWVASIDGQNPPAIQAPLIKGWVIGTVYKPIGQRYTLGPWRLPSKTGARVIQDWDFSRIEKQIGHSVFPFVLRLSPKIPGHYERQWPGLTAVPPSRHLAYMMQWWIFALVWLVGGVLVVCKKK